MCGLAGYVGALKVDALPMLRRMAAAMENRGPDGEGFAAGREFGLAHRRLAIIDKDSGDQPLWSADGRHAIVYNGEVYNFRELRDELAGLGHEFATHCDTEVVLAAWREWGNAAFDRFNGMFALAIADRESGRVVLARDQFGIKPLYLARSADGVVVFASQFLPLFASRLVERRPDDATIYRYLRFRVHDDTESTFFAGVTRLLPGQLAEITPDGTVTRHTYTRLYDDMKSLAGTDTGYDSAAAEGFGRALHAAVRRRLVADVPVGTALSGGLDSSTIVALTHRMLAESDTEAQAVGTRQQTFSAVFPGELNDEERYVDAVANGRESALLVHKVQPSPDRFLTDLRDFVRTQEEPVISTGPYAQYCVMREASTHVTVMVDGQGADEMMAGYVPYYLVYLRQLWRNKKKRAALLELARSVDVLWRLVRFAVADRLNRRSRIPVEGLLDPEFTRRHSGERFDVVPDDLKARLSDDIFKHSLQSLLRYEDRNTMRFSVEGRVPFLDPELLRLLWTHDDAMILKAGWNKRALRDATADLLPATINRRRNKIGFTTPEETWFKRLKNALYEMFTSESFGKRPYFDQEAVVRAFKSYLAGRSSAETMTFWRVLNVELWMREFIDNDPMLTDTAADAAGIGDAPGMHPQAPPKSDYVSNRGKPLVSSDGAWARFPLRCDLVTEGVDIPELAADRVAGFFAGLDAAPSDVAGLAEGERWMLYVSEKIVAIAQGRSYFTWDVHPGWWARRLSQHVVRTPHGIGLGDPTTMQLAIQDVGLPRILAASLVSLAGKAFGRRGLFYRVAGASVRAIDGPTEYSAYPANVSAKLAPAEPDRVAAAISQRLRRALSPRALSTFGGTVIIDANDIGRNIMGHDTGLDDAELAAAFADNPLGQERQQTPLAVVVRHPRVSAADGDRGLPLNPPYRGTHDASDLDAAEPARAEDTR